MPKLGFDPTPTKRSEFLCTFLITPTCSKIVNIKFTENTYSLDYIVVVIVAMMCCKT